jgi:hypothetical protein
MPTTNSPTDNYDVNKGGVKFDDEKERFDLIPPAVLLEIADLYRVGANKYEDRNWERGMRFGRVFSAMMRHAWKWWLGEEHDSETGQHHLISVAWNAISLRHYLIYYDKYNSFDDRTKKPILD